LQIIPFVLFGLAGVLSLIAVRRSPAVFRSGISSAIAQAKSLSLRVPLAIISAGFIAHIIPQATVARYLGPDSGVAGIFVATVVGGLLPGGPSVAFPVALLFVTSGAGIAQLVTLLVSWSIFALHRMFIYELPILGFQFTRVRLLSTFALPPMAGIVALLIVDYLYP